MRPFKKLRLIQAKDAAPRGSAATGTGSTSSGSTVSGSSISSTSVGHTTIHGGVLAIQPPILQPTPQTIHIENGMEGISMHSTGFVDEETGIMIPPRSASPVPSVRSVSDSIREKFYRNINGRLYGNHWNPSYLMPVDDEENLRNEELHSLFKMLRGGENFVGPVRDVLQPTPDRPQKSVLDMGCGTGLWLRNMSEDFPDVNFVGVDLMPVKSGPVPKNCRFEVDDLNLGLSHFYDSFDFVHERCVCGGIHDFRYLIDEISRILVPRGLVLLQEHYFIVFNSAKEPIWFPLPENWDGRGLPPTKGQPGFNFTSFWAWTVGKAFDGDIVAPEKMEDWLKTHDAFEEVGRQDCWLPLGPWYDPPMTQLEWGQNYIGELKRRDIIALFSSTRQLILSYGMTVQEWDELETGVIRELTIECGRLRMYARLATVWARKRAI